MKRLKLFVPLGTQKFPFNRLILALNKLIEQKKYQPNDILVQSTIFDIEVNCNHVGLIPINEFNQYMEKAEVIVTHSGVNSIISSMKLQKPLIIVPRLHKYGEHVDDHQLEIANLMENKFNILVLKDINDLADFIEEAKSHEYKPWISHREELIQSIRNDIV